MPHFDPARLQRLRQEAFQELPSIKAAREHNDGLLKKLREHQHALQSKSDMLVCTVGSLARRELSSQSDVDLFTIVKVPGLKSSAAEEIETVTDELVKIAGRPPADDGAFAEVEDLDAMLANIGGNDDYNEKITRRVLFLLEGEWLTNEGLFNETRKLFINKYVKDTITSHQMALFLLNDIIRYYRTICVDFEFKTTEGKKPWGTRNIKLVFSRKLLYFSGVLAIAETVQRGHEEKREILLELFAMPVVDRLLAICGGRAHEALRLYDRFLGELGKPEVRSELNATTIETREKVESFRRLKDDGHRFSWELLSLFSHVYPPSHPIHRAIFL